jgi:hypothetical protein
LPGWISAGVANVLTSDRKLEADVVRWHHHTWGLMW